VSKALVNMAIRDTEAFDVRVAAIGQTSDRPEFDVLKDHLIHLVLRGCLRLVSEGTAHAEYWWIMDVRVVTS
jgi:hypothetical protein